MASLVDRIFVHSSLCQSFWLVTLNILAGAWVCFSSCEASIIEPINPAPPVTPIITKSQYPVKVVSWHV